MRKLLERYSGLGRATVFLLWTAMAFLYSFCGKKFLTMEAEILSVCIKGFWKNVVNAGILTTVQIALCHMFVHLEMDSLTNLRIARISHIIAAFATNISMTMTFASSTFAIKLTEPLITSLVQYLAQGVVLPVEDIMTLPIIVLGAMAFSGNPIVDTSVSLGVFTAMISNIAMSCRNVAFKGNAIQKETRIKFHKAVLNLKSLLLYLACVIIFVCCIEVYSDVGINISKTAMMCVLSALCNVLHAVISTGVVLTHISVVSHSVANIMKRVLVVLLLYMFGARVATAENFLGLGFCALGLFIYVLGKRQKEYDVHASQQGSLTPTMRLHSQKWLLGLLYCIIIISYIVTRGRVSMRIASTNQISEKGMGSFDRAFIYNAHKPPNIPVLQPDIEDALHNLSEEEVLQFLNERRGRNPEHINFVSKELKKSSEIIKESQRIHFQTLGQELRKYKYAILLDVAAYENKGDPCIGVGEIYFLARLHLDIIFYCETYSCSVQNMLRARDLAWLYKPDEVVILLSGGGNMVGYVYPDLYRFNVFIAFRGYHIFVFPQSILTIHTSHPHFQRCIDYYCCKENLTLVLRDLQSYSYARKYFNGSTRLLMAPDMSFQIGHVPRFMPPVFDIMWLRRGDQESPNFWKIPQYPKGIRVHVSDWWGWKTPNATIGLEKSVYMCTNGFFYLQRGRIIVTDRLHGHILATLMNIPHVLIDNKAKKLSSYHRTWTRSLENTLITDDPSKALDLAITLLDKYKHVLPSRVPFLNVSQGNGTVNFDRPDESYI